MNQRKLFAGIILLGVVSAPVAFAQSYQDEGFRIGSLEFEDVPGIAIGSSNLQSQVTTEGRYDSNIFLTPNNRKSDFIGIYSPELLWSQPFGPDQRYLTQLMYNAELATYSRYHSQNYINQNPAANLNFSLPWGYFNVQDNYNDTVDRADSEFTSLIRHRDNLGATTLGVECNKLTYEVGYQNFSRRYENSTYTNLDYDENIFTGTAYYQLFTKTKALLEYDHGIVDYINDSTRTGYYNDGMIGLKGDLTGKTVGTIKVGYKARDYDTSGQKGYSNFVAEANIITQLTERRDIELKYVRDVVESISNYANFYDTDAVTLIFRQRIKNSFGVDLSSGYEHDSYPGIDPNINTKELDNVWTNGIVIWHDFKKWARVSIQYQNLQKFSNDNTVIYKDNTVSFKFTFSF